MNRSYIASSRWHLNYYHLPSPSSLHCLGLDYGKSIDRITGLFDLKSMKMKKEDIARSLKFSVTPKKDHEVAVRVGNKVLPLNESTTTSSSSKNLNSNLSFDLKKEKGEKMKTISRMRELLRWAAAAKSEKGGKYIARKVAQFRNRTALKMTQDDDQMTNESPKISFRWEVESCSTFSSALSVSSTNKNDQNVNIEIHSNPDGNSSYASVRSGSWITSDSDFVVLEL